MQSYIYEPLRDDNLTRIVLLHGSKDCNAPLRCDVRQWRKGGPPYEALSYAWGDSSFKSMLLCNDQTHFIPLSGSLDIALRALRKPSETRRLWVDAVCINQLDNDERARQVRVMSHIYRMAFMVILWLGEDYEDGAKVLDFFRRHREVLRELEEVFYDWNVQQFPKALVPVSKDIRETFGELGLKPYQLMFQRPWFKRRWVIQEAVLARNASVRCGSSSLKLASFAMSALAINHYYALGDEIHGLQPQFLIDEHISDMLRGLARYNRSKSWAGLLTGSDRRPILELLSHFNAQQCLDDKDRIYALLGVSNDIVPETTGSGHYDSEFRRDAGKVEFPVTYVGETEDIYARFAAKIMQSRPDRPGEIMRLAGAFRGSVSQVHTRSLPTWVPDWRLPRRFSSMGDHWDYADPSSTCKDENLQWKIDDDAKKLLLSGWKHSVVSQKLDTSYDDSISSPELLRRTVHDWVRFYLGERLSDSQALRIDDTRLIKSEEWFYNFFDCIRMRRDLWMHGFEHPPEEFAELLFEGLLTRSTKFSIGESKMTTVWIISAVEGGSNVAVSQPSAEESQKEQELEEATEEPASTIKSFEQDTMGLVRSCTRTILKLMKGRKLFKNDEGDIINCPSDAEVGDIVATFYNARCPFVLRPTRPRKSPGTSEQIGEEYALVGDCYIDGFMGNRDFPKVQRGKVIQFVIV